MCLSSSSLQARRAPNLWQGHLKNGHILGRVDEFNRSSVRLDYRTHQAQAEPHAVSWVAASALPMKEPLKDSLPACGQRNQDGIEEPDFHEAISLPGPELDPASGPIVPDGVAQEVLKGLE